MFLRGGLQRQQPGMESQKCANGQGRDVLRRTQCRVPIGQRQANEAEWRSPALGPLIRLMPACARSCRAEPHLASALWGITVAQLASVS